MALADAAAWLAQPRHWGLTTPDGDVGGAHAGYRIYPCADGRVAVAALEPHFLPACAQPLGYPPWATGPPCAPLPRTRRWRISSAPNPAAQLDALALAQDIPLHTLA